MTTVGMLDQGRESFGQQAWAGAYALLSSADQVPRSVGEGFAQVSAQFRRVELEELGQTPPRLVEHVVARLYDSGAVKLIARLEKRIAALSADAVPDDPSVSVMGRIREQQGQARGRVAVLLASDRYLELHERLSAVAAKPHTAEAVDQQASQAMPPLVHHAWRRLAKRAEVVLEDESGLPGVRRTPNGTRCVSPPSVARYAGESVAPVLREEAGAFARQMEQVTEILSEHQDAADAAIRELATSADAPASFTLGVLHAADASGLRRPAAGSRRCRPKSAAANGADG